MILNCFVQTKTFCMDGCIYLLAALVLVSGDVMVMSSAWNASFKLTSGCVVSICCVGFASLDVICGKLNDCAWKVCL